MRFVLSLSIALIIRAQAAPQSNFASGDWRSLGSLIHGLRQRVNANWNRNNGIMQHGLPSQSTFTEYPHPNNDGRQTHANQQESWGMCWYPVDNTDRDRSNRPSSPQYSSPYYNPQMNPNLYPMNNFHESWDGPQRPTGPSPPQHHHHGHGPPPHSQHHHGHGPPPHSHHHNGHGSPPPPPDHHHNHHHHPQHHHHHHDHDQHGPPPPPPPPPHHHRPGPPPSRPPHRPHNGMEYKLELCQDNTQENSSPIPFETSTSNGPGLVSSPSSLPLLSTTPKPGNGGEETATQSSMDMGSVKTTTEFDWNNYFVEVSPDNPGGSGVIDIRGGGIMQGN